METLNEKPMANFYPELTQALNIATDLSLNLIANFKQRVLHTHY